MSQKSRYFAQFWHNDDQLTQIFGDQQETNYYNIEKIKRCTGTHPVVMRNWLENGNYEFNPEKINTNLSLTKWVAYWLDSVLGWRLGKY